MDSPAFGVDDLLTKTVGLDSDPHWEVRLQAGTWMARRWTSPGAAIKPSGPLVGPTAMPGPPPNFTQSQPARFRHDSVIALEHLRSSQSLRSGPRWKYAETRVGQRISDW